MAESETNTCINLQYNIHDSIKSWYSPETGIYSSKHPYIHLPNDPFLDLVSHIFSYTHNGTYAFIDPLTGSSVKYSQLIPMVKSTAVGLKNMGVSKGDVVLILLPNSIHLPLLFLGVLYLGAIIVPMNPQSTFTEVKKLTVGLDVSLCFTLSENATKFRDLGLKVIEVFDRQNNGRFNDDFHNLIHNNIGVSLPRAAIKQDDAAAILFSSGTTGVSKGVVLTHRNFIAMVELFVRFESSQYKEKSWKNVYLDVLPMFHIYGISLFVFGLISLGTSIVVMKKFEIDQVVNVIERFKVTHFPVVPPALVMLTNKVKSLGSNTSFASLKQISCGAAPSTIKIISDFLDAFPGVDFIQGYGMTETTAIASRGFNAGGDVHKYTSVGLLAPNTQAKVVSLNTGCSLPPGKTGELLFRGPGIMKGYYNNLEATKLTIEEGGWLHTGDLAYFDNDGYLYIVDRLKEMIKYKGYQIAPADLEAILICHPDILDVVVAPVPDDLAGEIPVAFVVRRPGSLLCHDEVLRYVANKVSPYKKVRQAVFVNSLPRSPTGKVLRRQLKDSLICKL